MKTQRSIWASAFLVWLIAVGLAMLCTGPTEAYLTRDAMTGGAVLFFSIAGTIWLIRNRKFIGPW